MKDTILRAEHLSVGFRGEGGQQVQAVSDLSFSIARGETLGLVGESGCGKSSVARAVMQLPGPDSGRVLFKGAQEAETDLSCLPPKELRRIRHRFQMIFQNSFSSLNPRQTIMDILTTPLKIIGKTEQREREDQALKMLDAVGIDPENRHLKPFQLSGGQCQRVQIARALMPEPELLICDEPVSSLDVSIQAQILNLLEDLRKDRELSMLFISHDLAVVKNVCDRVMVMYLGRLCETAPCEKLYKNHCHPYTRTLIQAIPQPVPKMLPFREDIEAKEIPTAGIPPSGCRFRTRCPRAEPLCADKDPAFREIEPGHRVACHFPIQER